MSIRLPIPGQDDGSWGNILNDFLSQIHTADGGLKPGIITENKLDASVQTKLNNIAGGGVTSVNTRSGVVTLTKSDVGLASVDDTSDAAKPVSTATQTALDGKAALSHSHTSSQISDASAVGKTILQASGVAAARAALNLGDAATLNVGASAGTVAAGDDSRFDISAQLRKTDANLFWNGSGACPLRSTATTDTARRVRWICPVSPLTTTGYALPGDVWEAIS